MLKWSVSSVSDERPVVADKCQKNAGRKYSYDGSVADSSTSDTEHVSESVQATSYKVTDIALPEFRTRNFIVSIGLCTNFIEQKITHSLLPQGSDPRAATCRGKLQSKRSKLNVEINKAMMLRSGAENLYK